MPFGVQRSGKKWVVVNGDTGKVHGTHPTHAKAAAQMRAMYANGADGDMPKLAGGGQFYGFDTPEEAKVMQKYFAAKAAPIGPTKGGRGALGNLGSVLGAGVPTTITPGAGGRTTPTGPLGVPVDAKGVTLGNGILNYAAGGTHFIQKAIKKPGALHEDLGVPKGQTIPAGKLKAAAAGTGKTAERARFAEMLKGLRSGRGKK